MIEGQLGSAKFSSKKLYIDFFLLYIFRAQNVLNWLYIFLRAAQKRHNKMQLN